MSVHNKSWLEHSFMTFIMFLLFIPLIYIFILSFFTADQDSMLPTGEFTLKWYSKALSKDSFLESWVVSLIVGVSSALISCFVAFSLSTYIYLWPKNRSGKAMHRVQEIIMMTPDIIISIITLYLFSISKQDLGYGSLIVAHTTSFTGMAFLIIRTRMRAMPYETIMAARDLGASSMQIVWNIILPSSWGAIFTSFLLVCSSSTDDVVLSYFNSGADTVPFTVFLYSSFRFGSPILIIISCAMIMIISAMLSLFIYLIARYKSYFASKLYLIGYRR